MLNVYDNIVEIAKRRKMTLVQIEEEAGLGQGIITKWKNGNPTLGNLTAVANVLHVKVSTLVKEQQKGET